MISSVVRVVACGGGCGSWGGGCVFAVWWCGVMVVWCGGCVCVCARWCVVVIFVGGFECCVDVDW